MSVPKMSLGKLLFDGIKQYGDRVCLVDGDTAEQLTFRQLLERSVKLAVAFKRLGFKRSDTIALISENHIDFHTPYLAALYSGIIFNVLNPNYTKYELQIYLEKLSPRYVFCSKSSLAKIQELMPMFPSIQSVVLIGRNIDEDVIHLHNLINLGETDVSKYQPEEFDSNGQIALTYNSSGTTGLPKHVLMTHSIHRLIVNQIGPYGIDAKPEDVFVHNLPFFSVISLSVICSSFICGAKVVILAKFRPETFLTTIEKYRPNKMILVPYLVMFLLKSPLVDDYDLSSLQNISCGSARISGDTIKIFRKKFPNCVFNQMYGLTETCGVCIYNQNQENLSTIGLVLPEIEMKTIDADGKTLGPNETGEICLRGVGITKGYYKNDEATKQSFDNDGFFKTGDVGFYDDNNYVYIVDRIKDIITYKGFQVSPSEIEYVLLMHEGVRDAGVIGIPDERTGEVPLGFVALKEGYQTSPEELQLFVAEYLSASKHLHGGIRIVEEVPRNSLGKVDRKALKKLAAN